MLTGDGGTRWVKGRAAPGGKRWRSDGEGRCAAWGVRHGVEQSICTMSGGGDDAVGMGGFPAWDNGHNQPGWAQPAVGYGHAMAAAPGAHQPHEPTAATISSSHSKDTRPALLPRGLEGNGIPASSPGYP